MKIKQKLGFHNEFRIERRKAILHEDGTWSLGELIQEVFGYNLITNNGLNIAANVIGYRSSGNNSTYRFMRGSANSNGPSFGGGICLGNGAGTLDPARTELFSHLQRFTTDFHARELDMSSQWSSYTQVATVQPDELVGQDITEVGLSPNSSNTINTHAVLEDSEGNPITLLNKSDTEVLIIYAKVYFDTSMLSNNGVFVGEGLHDAVYRNGYYGYYKNISLGSNGDNANVPTNEYGVYSRLTSLEVMSAATLSGSKVIFSFRLSTIEGNGKIKEIGMGGMSSEDAEFPRNQYNDKPVGFWRIVLPKTGIFTGHTITDEEIGQADGATTVFTANWDEWNSDEVIVKVDGVEVTTGFTLDKPTGTITFDTAPSNGAITVTYGVDYIPKDDLHVLDIDFEFTFGDANAA